MRKEKHLSELVERIHDFLEERSWEGKVTMNTYNMLCNLSEETGEIWNVIKWIDNDEDMKKVIDKNQEELEDGIGDLLWCVTRLALYFGVDMHAALEGRLEEYKQRFPLEKIKGKKPNRSLGGYDGKYDE